MGAVLTIMGVAGAGTILALMLGVLFHYRWKKLERSDNYSALYAARAAVDAAAGWVAGFLIVLVMSSFIFGLLWLGRTRCNTFGAVNGVGTFWSASTGCLAETDGGLMLPPDQWYQLEGLK